MLSFLQYITEALSAADVAKAKANMARIAKQVMAKQASKKPVRDSGIDWADMSGDRVTAWWHPTKKAHVFNWVYGKQHHMNEIVRYPKIFGVSESDIHKVIEYYTEEDGISRSSPRWDEEVKENHRRFLDGSVDSYPRMAALAYKNGWVQIRKSGMIRMDGEFAGPRRSMKALFREMLDKIDSSPRHPEMFGIDIFFDDKGMTRIRGRNDIEKVINS